MNNTFENIFFCFTILRLPFENQIDYIYDDLMIGNIVSIRNQFDHEIKMANMM
jgi:hypothetical protein